MHSCYSSFVKHSLTFVWGKKEKVVENMMNDLDMLCGNPSFESHNPTFESHNPTFESHNPSFESHNPTFESHNCNHCGEKKRKLDHHSGATRRSPPSVRLPPSASLPPSSRLPPSTRLAFERAYRVGDILGKGTNARHFISGCTSKINWTPVRFYETGCTRKIREKTIASNSCHFFLITIFVQHTF